MVTTFLDLPPELVTNVFKYLDDATFFAARQASRHLERASFALFGKRFFRKKGYMITTPSLQVLRHVADHKELRKYVQHVWFNPDCFTFAPLMPPSNFDDPDTLEARQFEAHMACLRDHHSFLQLKKKLSFEIELAFLNLPNLKTVGMRRSDQHSPWGWSRLRDAVGRDPRDIGDIRDGPTRDLSSSTKLYVALIKALDASNARIQRFYTDAIEVDRIQPSLLHEYTVEGALRSLLYLEINATKGWIESSREDVWSEAGDMADEDAQFNGHLSDSEYGCGLTKLLSATPNLRELGLMIFPDRKQSHLVAPEPRSPESWRESYPYIALAQLSQTVSLQNLRRIKLEKFAVSTSTLISILEPSAQHLTSIKLRDIRLLPDLQTPDSNYEQDPDKPWQPVFSFLASCPKLSYLLLYHLAHPSGGIRFVQNLPPPPPEDPDMLLPETMAVTGDFTDYENIAVEVGVPHNDPDSEGHEKRARILRARQAVGDRVRALVDGHWYGKNTFSYEMDEMVWHTDTSDEEW